MNAFVDTNILVYSISDDEPRKRDRARAILDGGDCALSVQVLQEFYVQATRATRSNRLSHEQATGLVESWTRFPVQDNTLTVMWDALRIRAAHGLSYWDSAILAAARQLDCSELITEDLAHGRQIEGVTIIDPFR